MAEKKISEGVGSNSQPMKNKQVSSSVTSNVVPHKHDGEKSENSKRLGSAITIVGPACGRVVLQPWATKFISAYPKLYQALKDIEKCHEECGSESLGPEEKSKPKKRKSEKGNKDNPSTQRRSDIQPRKSKGKTKAKA